MNGALAEARPYGTAPCWIEGGEARLEPTNPSRLCLVGEGTSSTGQPKLLDQLRQALRARHYSPGTEKVYVMWVRRFIYFHGVRHPAEMAEPEMNAFLTHLAVRENVAAST